MSENNKLLEEINNEIINEEATEPEGTEIDMKKEEELQRKSQALLDAVHANKTDNISQKVASILNKYPEARKSDITLQIKYWQEFENISSQSVTFQDLYRLERLTSVSRARAKIQNEYKLFLSDEKTIKQRRDREEILKEAALLDKPIVPLVHIYADETGLNDNYIIVGSVWVLDDKQNGRITNSLSDWVASRKNETDFPKEFHFKELNNRNENELRYYKEYFSKLISDSGMVSFRAIAVNKTKISVPMEEIVSDLYYRLVKMGVEHEINRGRLELPKQISYIKDSDSKDNRYTIEKMSELLINNFKELYNEDLKLNSFMPLDSKLSRFIQQADLFSGSLNRIYNHRPNNTTNNNKDKLADYIYDQLDVNVITYSVNNLGEDLTLELIENDRATFLIFD